MAITTQEAWCEREGLELIVPPIFARPPSRLRSSPATDKRVDKRSGVSQRLPISVLENVISNAERRAVLEGSGLAVPRISDIYAAMPSITGKLELEYEGEMKGADTVAREVIQAAVAKTFDRYFGAERSEAGGAVVRTGRTGDADRQHQRPTMASRAWRRFRACWRRPKRWASARAKPPESIVSAAEFILEGLHAHKRIGRTEDRVFTSGEKPRRSERDETREEFEADWEQRRKNRRPFN